MTVQVHALHYLNGCRGNYVPNPGYSDRRNSRNNSNLAVFRDRHSMPPRSARKRIHFGEIVVTSPNSERTRNEGFPTPGD